MLKSRRVVWLGVAVLSLVLFGSVAMIAGDGATEQAAVTVDPGASIDLFEETLTAGNGCGPNSCIMAAGECQNPGDPCGGVSPCGRCQQCSSGLEQKWVCVP